MVKKKLYTCQYGSGKCEGDGDEVDCVLPNGDHADCIYLHITKHKNLHNKLKEVVSFIIEEIETLEKCIEENRKNIRITNDRFRLEQLSRKVLAEDEKQCAFKYILSKIDEVTKEK